MKYNEYIKNKKGIQPIRDSIAEQIRKTLPNGYGSWIGFDHVYNKLKQACYKISNNYNLSNEHDYLIAVLGCGHEETMKYEMSLCISRGWCK